MNKLLILIVVMNGSCATNATPDLGTVFLGSDSGDVNFYPANAVYYCAHGQCETSVIHEVNASKGRFAMILSG